MLVTIKYLTTVFRLAFVGVRGNLADGLFEIADAIRYFADTVKQVNNK